MTRKIKVTRFSVSLPPPLLRKLDETWKSMQYEDRSKAIHDAIRSFISEFEWMKKETGQITGAILILYYLDKPGLLDEITRAQHKFHHVISSTTHIHLEEKKRACPESYQIFQKRFIRMSRELGTELK